MIAVLFLDATGKVYGANTSGMNIDARPTNPVPVNVFEFAIAPNIDIRDFVSKESVWPDLTVTNPGTAQAKLRYRGNIIQLAPDPTDVTTNRAARQAYKNLANAAPLADPVQEAFRLVIVELGKRVGILS